MSFSGLTLKSIAGLESPKKLATLVQQAEADLAFKSLQRGLLDTHEVYKNADGSLDFKFVFIADTSVNPFEVSVKEQGAEGELNFCCNVCSVSRKDEDEICVHEWASLVLIWWGLVGDRGFLKNHSFAVSHFCEDFWALNESPSESNDEGNISIGVPRGLKLDSISYITEVLELDSQSALYELIDAGAKTYTQIFPDDKAEPAAGLWGLPQAFRGNLNKETTYWADIRLQESTAGILRYNFSDGTQISSKDILRHPYKNVIAKDLLPGPSRKETFEVLWPLLPQENQRFYSRDLLDVELVMQELLSRIIRRSNKGDLAFYIQDSKDLEKAFPVQKVSMEAESDFHWEVHFVGGEQTLELQAALVPKDLAQKYIYFDNFALDKHNSSVSAYSFRREATLLSQFLRKNLDQDLQGVFSKFQVSGAENIGRVMKYLRSRPFAVVVKGGAHNMGREDSYIDLHHQENGGFIFDRVFKLGLEQTVVKKGFSSKPVLLLRTLQDGLGFLLNSDVKAFASTSFKTREWDLKLLKHLGVLQYLSLETLALYFDGKLTDGSSVSIENIVPALSDKIQGLIVSGEGQTFNKETPLNDLCSKSSLALLTDFSKKLYAMVSEPESVYVAQGEFVYSGAVEREFGLIYEILKHMATQTQGTAFKRSRTGLLTKIWDGDLKEDSFLERGNFFFPSWGKNEPTANQTLGFMQPLMDYGVNLYIRGHKLEELGVGEFKVDFQIVSKIDEGMLNWFELNPRFFLQGQEINQEQLKSFGGGVVEYDGKFYLVPRKEIPSLRRLEFFWQKLQGHKKDAHKKSWNDKYYQLPKHQALELLALRASGYEFRGDDEWKKICSFYDSLGKRSSLVEVPKSVRAELKSYQHEGMQWLLDLYTLRMGALLADDMGLGKTLQALAFLDHLRCHDQLGQVLVIVPSSLVYNWEAEIQKFTPDLPLDIFSSKDQDRVGKKLESKQPLVLVTTYGLLMENSEFFAQYNWNVLIFDEAQNLKNISAKRTGAARMLNARFKLCLTGTPLENHYGEFYSLLDLIVPGSLGKYDDFRRHFVNTDVVLLEDVEDLKLKVKPLVLRRSKREILNQLPEKQETKVPIAFEERQKRIYRDIALAYNERIQNSIKEVGEARSQLQMLTALLRLRQACSDPSALPDVKYEQVPPKLEAMVDSISEIVESGESALVFTQFLPTLERTSSILKSMGIPVFVLHGAVPTKQRQKILKDFNETEGGAVLVMTLKTGGVGLNLTKASYVFHLEPWWNPSVENQATDRAHRLGQKKAVQVFRYIMHESLEEKMELLKERKNRKFDSLFSDAEKAADLENITGTLTKDDFDFLLGLK